MSAKPITRIALASLLLVSTVACSSPIPSTTTASSTPTSSANPRANPDKQEVQDTGCDKPASTVKETTSQVGEYGAKLEVRRSDNAMPQCKNLFWLRLTPMTLPSGPKDKEFAAVLRVGNSQDAVLTDWARQDARSSDPKVELITKGRILNGLQVQGCLVVLTTDGQLSQNFVCTVPYKEP